MVLDEGEVCVSGSWFISRWEVLACATRAAHRPLMEPAQLSEGLEMFRKVQRAEGDKLKRPGRD